MLKERILFLGIGQCGGNIAKTMYDAGYFSYFINTADVDLQSLEVPEVLKCHIPTTYGCNGNRKKGAKIAINNLDYLTNRIFTNFPRQDIIYVCFSLGGGTGSGISVPLVGYLADQFKNKVFNVVTVLPALDEGNKYLANSIEAYQDLEDVSNSIGNIHVLDNNTMDKIEINNKFAKLFDRFVHLDTPHPRGDIDKAELEDTLYINGLTVMGELDTLLGKNSIYAPTLRGMEVMTLSMTRDISLEPIEYIFGEPAEHNLGWNNQSDFLVGNGLPTCMDERLQKMANITNTRLRQRKQFNKQSNKIEVPEISRRQKRQNSNDSDSFDKFFGKYMEV